jgi:hypothetical protein
MKPINIFKLFVVSAAIYISGTLSAPAVELLTNGGFENEPNFGNGVINGPDFSALTGSQIPGWTIVTGHAVTIHQAPGQPTISGTYTVNTDGEGFNGHNADFYQDFSTTLGTSYTFGFDWFGWQNNAPNTQLQVSITDLTTSAVLYDGLFSYSAALSHESQALLGTGDVFRLQIQETPESGFNDNQFLVDNFSVTTAAAGVPEQGSSWLLLAMSFLFLVAGVIRSNANQPACS